MKIIFVYIVFFLILCIQADELDPLSDYLKGKILFAKIKSKTISTTTSTSHIVDDTFGDTLGEKIILAGIGSFVTALIREINLHFDPFGGDIVQTLKLSCTKLFKSMDHQEKENITEEEQPLFILENLIMKRYKHSKKLLLSHTDSHNIFKHFTSKEYRQILDEIRHSILATDRALFFANHSKLAHIVDSSQFNWDNQRTYVSSEELIFSIFTKQKNN
ncbi:unnamed protein product [Rotaria socialis]